MANWTPEAGRHAEDTRKTKNGLLKLKLIGNQLKLVAIIWKSMGMDGNSIKIN